jgi:hypothetical protein
MRYTSDIPFILAATSRTRTSLRQEKLSQRGDALLFVPPARPGESRCLGGRRRRGFRTRWPLSITVRDRGLCDQRRECRDRPRDRRDIGQWPCARCDRHRAGRDRRGRLSLTQSPGRPPGSYPARHTGVACSRNARLRDRSCDRSARHASPRSPESIPAASLSVASLVTCLARPRGRVFVPKCPKAEMAPQPGKGCHAATGARIVPWRQPGDWLINLPIASTALLRSDPDLQGLSPRRPLVHAGYDPAADIKYPSDTLRSPSLEHGEPEF